MRYSAGAGSFPDGRQSFHEVDDDDPAFAQWCEEYGLIRGEVSDSRWAVVKWQYLSVMPWPERREYLKSFTQGARTPEIVKRVAPPLLGFPGVGWCAGVSEAQIMKLVNSNLWTIRFLKFAK